MKSQIHHIATLQFTVLRAALISCCLITPGMADPAPETLSATVSLAGVPLSTAAGQQIAHERLQKAAQRLCSRLEGMHPQSLAHHPTYVRCVDETLARALRQVNGPALAAMQAPSMSPMR